jgi:gliding motility-associated-like protein
VGSINWYDQLTAGTLLGSANKLQTANLTLSKNYFAEAVYNGCISTSRTTVQALVRNLPTFTNTDLVEVCYPGTIDISKDTLIKSSSSVLTYSYWKDATTLQTITNPTTINQTGIYYIKGTDVYNCASTNPISLRINAQPAKMIVSDIEYCQFKTINPVVLAPGSNTSLKWYIDGLVYDQSLPPLPNIEGSYLYEVSQVYNTTKCESIKSAFNIIVHKLPVVSINASQNPICLNDNLTLSGKGAVTYIWNKSVFDNTPFVIQGSDQFNVIGTDQFGCQNVDSVQIKTLELPVVNAIPNVLNVCVGNAIDLTSYVNKGQSPYRYFFNTDPVYLTGNSNGKIASILNGKNTVTFYVKDANGCVSNISNSFAVGAYNPLASTFINQQAFFNEPTIIKTKLDSGYTSYTWTPEVNLNYYNDKNPIFKGETGVVYSLLRQDTVTKCIVIDTYNIDVTEEFLFYVPSAFTPNNDGLNDMLKIVKNAGILKINYFKIFNRNGTMVFSSNDINDAWDGKYMNVLQEPDAYYWVAEYVTKMNDVIRKNGNTAIIR